MDPKKPERFYPVSVVAKMLCVSRSFIYFQMSCGAIRFVKHGKRAGYRVPASAINEYLHRLQNDTGNE